MTTTDPDDDVDELAEEPPETFYRRLVDQATAAQQHGTTDPAIADYHARVLAFAHRELDRATITNHWETGEGDRKLF